MRTLKACAQSFFALEQKWLTECNSEEKKRLYKEVEKAEVNYAIRLHMYDDILVGNQTIQSIAKEKTRNRMRTRLQNNVCIGLPEKGRAVPRKRKRVSRLRVDPESRQIISWEMFCARNSPSATLHEQWRALPRVRPPAKQRVWRGYAISWQQCVAWFRDDYEMKYLFDWFQSLQRAT